MTLGSTILYKYFFTGGGKQTSRYKEDRFKSLQGRSFHCIAKRLNIGFMDLVKFALFTTTICPLLVIQQQARAGELAITHFSYLYHINSRL